MSTQAELKTTEPGLKNHHVSEDLANSYQEAKVNYAFLKILYIN